MLRALFLKNFMLFFYFDYYTNLFLKICWNKVYAFPIIFCRSAMKDMLYKKKWYLYLTWMVLLTSKPPVTPTNYQHIVYINYQIAFTRYLLSILFIFINLIYLPIYSFFYFYLFHSCIFLASQWRWLLNP